jgi:hypothetical protein
MATPAPEHPLSPGTDNAWPRQRRRTWFAIAGAPAAWVLHLCGGWYVSGNGCLLGTRRWGSLSAGDVWTLQVVVAIACIALAGAALAVGILEWRASDNRRLTEVQASARPDFLAAVAVMVAGAFLLAVVYNSLAQLVLPLCEATR